MWVLFSLLAALASAVVVTLSKVGIKNVNPSLAFAIQSICILIVSWGVVIGQGMLGDVSRIDRKVWIYLLIGGVVTCISSLLSFRALKLTDAARASPLDKVSLVFTIILAVLFLKEKVNAQLIIGAVLMAIGAVMIALSR
ncbi:EamA family transporter [Larkinella arboricola]|uniref:Transporter family protein n=1 Tax=Larkinella arboricola TaxID=643671 RepID=A0A327X9M3_LARAB|nr:EamA family transporter [Larkinella arboricola]RAK00367.1 transporter family protein [Larkinella arboricola]